MIINIQPEKEISIQKKYQQCLAFKGEKNNPFLAPRGVFMFDKTLVVSDTGQNRIFIWNNFLYQKFQDADIILGQTHRHQTDRNDNNNLSAATLQYPSGVWTNGEKLIVADAWNHRVLIWHEMPKHNGQAADIVIGQKDFHSNEPNINGVGKKCAVNSLYWCYGVFSNGKELWIADTGNRRVLYFENIPTKNFKSADAVIGQNTFDERDYDNQNAIWPYAVKINADGAMCIADTQYYRILFWNHWQESLHKKEPIIIGQENIAANGQNQFQLKPTANTLSWCYDACFFKQGMAIADTGNSRVLIKNALPKKNNEAADDLVGQINFSMNGEASLSMKTNLQNEMYWPFAIATNEEKLIVADTGNHQILFYK